MTWKIVGVTGMIDLDKSESKDWQKRPRLVLEGRVNALVRELLARGVKTVEVYDHYCHWIRTYDQFGNVTFEEPQRKISWF